MPASVPSPLGAVVRGALAGAVGTAAMDLVWFRRYRRGGGQEGFVPWELSSGLTWEDAPAPAQLGKRVVEGVLQRELSPDAAPLVNNVVHWSTGLGWGAAYGLVAGSVPRPRVAYGLVFGPLVWSTGYVLLPLAKLYKPIWEYDLKTLAKDFSAHLVFGVKTAAAFRILARRSHH